MRYDLTFYPFACVLLILLALLFCRFWQGGKSALAGSKPPRRKPHLVRRVENPGLPKVWHGNCFLVNIWIFNAL
jgi:hypothetical protein